MGEIQIRHFQPCPMKQTSSKHFILLNTNSNTSKNKGHLIKTILWVTSTDYKHIFLSLLYYLLSCPNKHQLPINFQPGCCFFTLFEKNMIWGLQEICFDTEALRHDNVVTGFRSLDTQLIWRGCCTHTHSRTHKHTNTQTHTHTHLSMHCFFSLVSICPRTLLLTSSAAFSWCSYFAPWHCEGENTHTVLQGSGIKTVYLTLHLWGICDEVLSLSVSAGGRPSWLAGPSQEGSAPCGRCVHAGDTRSGVIVRIRRRIDLCHEPDFLKQHTHLSWLWNGLCSGTGRDGTARKLVINFVSVTKQSQW